MIEKPFSAASANNQQPILKHLRQLFAHRHKVFEIGSGTGQHAVYFADSLPHLLWQPSDRAENLAGIRRWQQEADLGNCLPPLCFDVCSDEPPLDCDAVFSANTVHIMPWSVVGSMFAVIGALLPADGCFVLYGPFNYQGRYTSDSNARFDQWLRQEPGRGIRDFEKIVDLASRNGMTLLSDDSMPANNRLLAFKKSSVRGI